MKKRFKYGLSIIAIVALLILYFYWTRPYNYLDPALPSYLYQPDVVCYPSDDDGDFTVITYNIKHGEKVAEALEIIETAPIRGDQLILLQEVHADAVDQLAEQLGMYSVYYPLNKGYFSDQDFGNAILATVPLTEPQKVVFPYGQLHNGRRRGMTLAMTCLGGKSVLVASVHASTLLMSAAKRKEQIQFLTEILTHYDGIVDVSVIGGDFNAVKDSYRGYIRDELASIGYSTTTIGLGSTHRAPISIMDAELDIIFCESCNILDAGVIRDAAGSDHFPVWAYMDK